MRICKCFAFTTVLLICVSRFQYAFSACMRDAAFFFQSTYMRKIFGFNPNMRQFLFSRCIYATVQVFRVFLETIVFHMRFPHVCGMPPFFFNPCGKYSDLIHMCDIFQDAYMRPSKFSVYSWKLFFSICVFRIYEGCRVFFQSTFMRKIF